MAAPKQQSSDTSATIVSILLIVFIYPVGLIVMWFWPKWPIWVKTIITLPFIGLVAAIILVISNPSGRTEATTPSPSPTATLKPVR